jgi:hypothetical protein
MCFPRKPSLGRYNASRADWAAAYRAARVLEKNGQVPDSSFSGVRWKACLIVAFERHDHVDPLVTPIKARLASKRLIDDILAPALELTSVGSR